MLPSRLSSPIAGSLGHHDGIRLRVHIGQVYHDLVSEPLVDLLERQAFCLGAPEEQDDKIDEAEADEEMGRDLALQRSRVPVARGVFIGLRLYVEDAGGMVTRAYSCGVLEIAHRRALGNLED